MEGPSRSSQRRHDRPSRARTQIIFGASWRQDGLPHPLAHSTLLRCHHSDRPLAIARGRCAGDRIHQVMSAYLQEIGRPTKLTSGALQRTKKTAPVRTRAVSTFLAKLRWCLRLSYVGPETRIQEPESTHLESASPLLRRHLICSRLIKGGLLGIHGRSRWRHSAADIVHCDLWYPTRCSATSGSGTDYCLRWNIDRTILS
jgi:hypothetical protein